MAELKDVVQKLDENKRANDAAITSLKGTFDKHFAMLKRGMLDKLEADIEANNKSRQESATVSSGGGAGGFKIPTLGGLFKGVLAGITALGAAMLGLRGWEMGAIKKLRRMFSKEGSIGRLFSNAFDSIKNTISRRLQMVKDIWGKDPEKSFGARIKNWYNRQVTRMRSFLGMADDIPGEKVTFLQRARNWFAGLRQSLAASLGITMVDADGKKVTKADMTLAQRVRNYFSNMRTRISQSFGLTMANVDPETQKFQKFTLAQRVRSYFGKMRTSLLTSFGLGDEAMKAAGAGDDVAKMSVMQRIKTAFDAKFKSVLAMFGLDAADYAKTVGGATDDLAKGKGGGLLARLGGMIDNLVAPIRSMITGARTWMSGAGKAMMDFFKPFLGAAGGFAKMIGKFLKPIGVVFSLFDGFKAYQNQEGGFLAKIGAGVAEAVADFFGMPLDLLKDIVSWAAGKLGFKNAEKFLDSFSFDKIFKDILRSIFGLGGKTKDFLVGLIPTGEDIKAFGKKLLPSFDFDIGNPLPFIGKTIGGVFDSMGNLFSEYLPSWAGGDSLSSWAKGTGDSIRKMFGANQGSTAATPSPMNMAASDFAGGGAQQRNLSPGAMGGQGQVNIAIDAKDLSDKSSGKGAATYSGTSGFGSYSEDRGLAFP